MSRVLTVDCSVKIGAYRPAGACDSHLMEVYQRIFGQFCDSILGGATGGGRRGAKPRNCKFTVVVPEIVVTDAIQIFPCSDKMKLQRRCRNGRRRKHNGTDDVL